MVGRVDDELPDESGSSHNQREEIDQTARETDEEILANKLTARFSDHIENLYKGVDKRIENYSESKRFRTKVDDQVSGVTRELEDRLERKIEDSKIRVIEALAVFVALFTFISVEFQLFGEVASPLAFVVLTLILLGALAMFVLITHKILHRGIGKIWVVLLVLSIVFIVTAVIISLKRDLNVFSDLDNRYPRNNEFQDLKESFETLKTKNPYLK